MSARTRLIGIVVTGVAAALALAAVIGARTSEGRRAALVQARDAHLINALRDDVESRLAIGLTLEQLEALQPVIERERASSREIVSIDVFSAAGVLAYSTDPGAIGRPEAREWVPQLASPGLWRIERPLERVVGTRLENDLGEPLGGIGVTLAETGRAAPARPSGLPDLDTLAGLAAWVAALLIGSGVLVGLVIGRTLRPYREVTTVLRGGEAPVRAASALAAQAAVRRQGWGEAEAVIDQGLARLRELDDGA